MPPQQPNSSSVIKWHEVTWYSKLGAIILFVGVVPVLCFYIGTQYQLAQQSLSPNILIQSVSQTNSSHASNVGTLNLKPLPYEKWILGHYTFAGNFIDITPIDDTTVHITGTATYQPQGSMGDIDFTAPVFNNHIRSDGPLYPHIGKPPYTCVMDLDFKLNSNASVVLDARDTNYDCASYGMNVNFRGTYSKAMDKQTGN